MEYTIKLSPKAIEDLQEIKSYIENNTVFVIRILYSKRDFLNILFS